MYMDIGIGIGTEMDMDRFMITMSMDMDMGIDIDVAMDVDMDMDSWFLVPAPGPWLLVPAPWFVDLAIAIFMGIRTDSFMHIDIDMPMFIRSNTVPKFSLIRQTNMTTLVQQLSKIDSNMFQHGVQDGLLGIRAIKRGSCVDYSA